MFGSKTAAPTKLSAPKAIVRSNHTVLTVVGVVAGFACMIPGIAIVGAGLTHLVDRTVNHMKAQDEIKARADYYRNVVAKKLNIDPRKVGVKEFMMVAKGDPTFGKVIADVKAKEASENRESALINTGVAVLGPVGEAAKIAKEGVSMAAKVGKGALELGKMGAVTLAGSKLSSMFDSEKINTQQVVERIHECLMDADQRGLPRKGAVTAQLVFVLRVAQDQNLADEIKARAGKPFHKLSAEEQLTVMQNYPALANAVTAEAYSLNAGNLQPQEMAAMAPNLKTSSMNYRSAGAGQSYVQALQAQRAAAAAASTAMPT